MPASGPKDEAKWQKAKQQAAKSKGKSVSEMKGDDYAFVMSIYKKMKPDYFKGKKASPDDLEFALSLKAKMASHPEFRESLIDELVRFVE